MPLQMKYFVLKPKGNNQHAAASRMAMLTCADVIKFVDSCLAEELCLWVEAEQSTITSELTTNDGRIGELYAKK